MTDLRRGGLLGRSSVRRSNAFSHRTGQRGRRSEAELGRRPVAQEVAHGELHALVAQTTVNAGHVIEKVRDGEREQELAAAGAYRPSAVLENNLPTEAGLEFAWSNFT